MAKPRKRSESLDCYVISLHKKSSRTFLHNKQQTYISFPCFHLQICFVFYFIYILSCPGSQLEDTSQDQPNSEKSAENANIGNSSVKFEDSKVRFTQGGDDSGDLSGQKSARNRRTEFSIKPPSVELWKGLYQRHWPQLLNYYNISLLGR